MKNLIIILGLVFALSLNISAAEGEPVKEPADAVNSTEENSQKERLAKFLANYKWTKGPATGALGDVAEVDVPEGFMLCDGNDTRSILQAFGNIVGTRELGLMAPENFDWFVVFEFDPVGYVKDDEKDSLDADGMLSSIKRGTEAGNKMRAQQGIPPMTIVGWEIPPHYNDQTKLLEWSIRAQSEGESVLNHNTRILGRKGVMEVALVIDPTIVKETLPVFYKLLGGYSFKEGQKYAQFQDGDKVAKYGLAALVVGGAAVGAAKLGLFAWLAMMFKKLWKVIIIAIVAVGAGIKNLFGKVVTKVDEPGPEDRN